MLDVYHASEWLGGTALKWIWLYFMLIIECKRYDPVQDPNGNTLVMVMVILCGNGNDGNTLDS